MEVSSYRKKRKQYNIWRETIKFFNSKINQEVTRQVFFGNVKRWGRFSLDSRDSYRLILQKAGYLETIGRGKYRVIKEIPDISLTLMQDFAHPKEPMGWLKYWSGLEYYLETRRKNGKGRNKENS